ncbi:hypothetical protein ACFL1B_05970 [Nanoarchaeota archaeon]
MNRVLRYERQILEFLTDEGFPFEGDLESELKKVPEIEQVHAKSEGAQHWRYIVPSSNGMPRRTVLLTLKNGKVTGIYRAQVNGRLTEEEKDAVIAASNGSVGKGFSQNSDGLYALVEINSGNGYAAQGVGAADRKLVEILEK